MNSRAQKEMGSEESRQYGKQGENPIAAIMDRKSKWTAARVLTKKGNGPYSIKAVARDMIARKCCRMNGQSWLELFCCCSVVCRKMVRNAERVAVVRRLRQLCWGK